MAIGLGIIGASGKMGRRLLEIGSKDPDIFIAGKASRGNEFDNLQYADIAIDFSNASLLSMILEFGLRTKKPLVIGTTGHALSELEAMKETSRYLPIFHAPNFSVGAAALIEAVGKISESLPEDFSISIEECHHIHKKDIPSGTALTIAAAISVRKPIIHSKREGETVGEHEVVFSNPEEKIILRHSATSRDLFAKGALFAAKFLIKKPAGLYTMKDLL
jgi:4-hydroxy-tetrahydrodipicolinate reductase